MEYTTQNNSAQIVGEITTPPAFSHRHFDEDFFVFTVRVPRLSGVGDFINVMISEKLICALELEEGTMVEVSGQYRSYNNYSGKGSKLVLSLFARDIKLGADIEHIDNPNAITLDGYICKPPVYRTTPFSREIADILLAVNRSYGKSDYIPCIVWGRNAKFASSLEVGAHIRLSGRIQSREYQKKYEDGSLETKTAFEISVSKLDVIDAAETPETEVSLES